MLEIRFGGRFLFASVQDMFKNAFYACNYALRVSNCFLSNVDTQQPMGQRFSDVKLCVGSLPQTFGSYPNQFGNNLCTKVLCSTLLIVHANKNSKIFIESYVECMVNVRCLKSVTRTPKIFSIKNEMSKHTYSCRF